MSESERLDVIIVKVERAKDLLQDLESEVRSFIDSKPYIIGVRRESEPSQNVYFIDSIQSLPLKVSAIIGDVIHNLRTALDHLAYQLVLVGTEEEPSTHIYFPIGNDESDYINRRDRQIQGALPQAIAEIDALTPYKGGNDLLWQLHKLDIIDKHRVLITAGSAYHSVNMGALTQRDMLNAIPSDDPDWSDFRSGIAELLPIDLSFKSDDRMFPLKHGDILLNDVTDADPVNVEFQFQVAFGEEGVINGEPITETLASIVTLVEEIVSKFEPHLE